MVLILKDGTPAQRAAAGELILALHAAKQELAADLETNLKQLKVVLEETKRIARDLEAVLQEAKGEQPPEARGGNSSAHGDQGNRADEPQWNPPRHARRTPPAVPQWDPPSEQGEADQ